jgi:predicted RNA polymerase sigma factor
VHVTAAAAISSCPYDEAATPAHVQAWHAERDRLVGLAYRMLGSVVEAEEVVQEAFLRLHRSPEVADPGAWLTTVVSRPGVVADAHPSNTTGGAAMTPRTRAWID